MILCGQGQAGDGDGGAGGAGRAGLRAGGANVLYAVPPARAGFERTHARTRARARAHVHTHTH